MSINYDRYIEAEPPVMAEAVMGDCPNCGAVIMNYHAHVRWEEYYFCDAFCFMKYMGAENIG
jgi:ribosomal protein S27AE